MKVAVYLGSAEHCRPIFLQTAYELGRRLAEAGHTLVYGGANVGTMKELTEGALVAGGHVIGVFPEGFRGTREVRASGIDVVRRDLTEMHFTADFAGRKKLMEEISDCCVALPGSYGTLDELFTFACDRCIDVHSKQCYVLNIEGFYDPLKAMIQSISDNGFLKPSATGILTFCDTIDELIEKL